MKKHERASKMATDMLTRVTVRTIEFEVKSFTGLQGAKLTVAG